MNRCAQLSVFPTDQKTTRKKTVIIPRGFLIGVADISFHNFQFSGPALAHTRQLKAATFSV
jgi:hypothetical protein